MRRLMALLLLSGVSVCLLPGALAQTVRQGSEFRVNTYTTNYQQRPRVSRGSSTGSFIVVWESNRQDGSSVGTFGRMFDGSGVPQGSAFQVNSFTTSYQSYPCVAANKNGSFVVAWQSYRQDGSYFGVFGQKYSSVGAKVANEFQVSTTTQYDQITPDLDYDATGKFVMVWTDGASRDGDGLGIFGQRYDQTGALLGVNFQINTYTGSSQAYPRVGRASAGNFMVVWQSYMQDGSDLGVYGQRFDNAGAKLGTEFRVNTSTAGRQGAAALAARGGDTPTFVVVWESPQDGSGYGIFGQRYNNAGTKLGTEFQINTYTTSDQRHPSVAIDSAGTFMVVWESLGQDGSLNGVFGQRYNTDGTPRSGEFRVNTYTTESQGSPAVSTDGSGNFVVVWQSLGQDGSSYGVFGQRFSIADCPTNLAVTIPRPANVSVCEGGSALLSVTASGGTPPYTYQWYKGSVPLDDGPFRKGSKTRTLTITNFMPIDAGNYSCVVTDYCLPGKTKTSASNSVTYNAAASVSAVPGLLVRKENGGTSLRFTWSNITNVTDYVVLEDELPDGAFTTITGSATSGTTGLTIPLTPVTTYYLVAGRNATCGIGPTQ